MLHVGVARANQTIIGYVDAQITYVVNPRLGINQTNFAFSEFAGSGLSPSQALGVTGSGIAWTASADQGWIHLDKGSGTGPGTVQITTDPTGLVPGTYAGIITISQVGGGDSLQVSVLMNIEAHKLLLNDTGIAFASMPTLSRLTRTLKVRDNSGIHSAWSARADQPWLSVTASGTTPDDLVVTADPTGLQADTIHYAKVTLSSVDSSVSNAETVNVGMWVGSADPSPTTLISHASFPLAVDPIRPYTYFISANATDIEVVHVHTGQLVRTIPSVASSLYEMVVSPDGSTLYAIDAVNHTIAHVDLATDTVGSAWPLGVSMLPHLAYLRTNGVGLLLTGNGAMFNAANGTQYATTFASGYYGNNVVATSLDGTRFCSMETGLSPSFLTIYDVTFTSAGGGSPLLTRSRLSAGGENSQDVALNPDGSKCYVASGFPYDFVVLDLSSSSGVTELPSLPGDAHPSNVEVGKDGRILAGASSSPISTWLYNSDGTLLKAYQIYPTVAPGLRISGDGLRIITIGAPAFITVP